MPASRGQGGMPGAAPLRSVIDFGADGAAAGPAAGAAGACVPTRTHSIESGLHHRSGSVGGGVGGSMGGGIGGASAAVHDGGLAFYAAEPQAAAAAAAYAGGAQPGRPQGLPMPAAGGMMGRGGGNGCAAGAYGGPTGQMSTAGAMPIKALGGSTCARPRASARAPGTPGGRAARCGTTRSRVGARRRTARARAPFSTLHRSALRPTRTLRARPPARPPPARPTARARVAPPAARQLLVDGRVPRRGL